MFRQKTKTMDMIEGPIISKLIIFALPIAITSTLQQLFNAADIIVCGRFVGSVALAAVGANSQIINLFINTFLGLSVGANVMIANYIGAGNKQKTEDTVQTSMSFAICFGIILMIVGLLFSKGILKFLGTPDDIIDPATLYLRVIFLCIPFIVIYNFGAAVLRSIGDTQRPLVILTITGVVNVILNLILVIRFNMGVAGVAIATAVSNIISSIVVVIILINEKSDVKYNIFDFKINLETLSNIMKVGVPSAVSGMVFSISNICVQSAINTLGTNVIAANTAALNIESFPYFIFTSFSSACITFMSQNYGAKKYERCKEVFKYCMTLSLLFAFILCMIIQVFGRNALLIFTTDDLVIDEALHRIRWATSITFIQSIYEIEGAGLRVLNHPVLPTIMVIIGSVVFRILWILFVFPIYRSYFIISIVYPISWTIINIATTIAYVKVSKKMLKPVQIY